MIMDFEREYLEDYPIPNKYLVDVNWDCNLNCRMCVKRGLDKPYGQKPLIDFINTVEKLPWAREVSLGCLGDAFSYKDLNTAMRYLDSKKTIAPLTTNGTQVTDENMKSLSSNTPLYISIDSGDDKQYQAIRGKDMLQVVKSNLRKLRLSNPRVPMAINHLVFNDNLQYVEELIKFLSPMRIPITFFYPIHFYKELEATFNFWNMTEADRINQLYKLKIQTNMYGLGCNIPNAKMQERVCFRAFTQPMIAYDGSVYPCDYIYQNMNDWVKPEWDHWFRGEVTKIPQYQYKMGNIFEDDFIDMWKSSKWRSLRSLLTKLNSKGVGKSYEEIKKEVDLSIPFEHCKVCLVRWSACL
jgi:MoaA/NifB/PqqE/SkfB family radical SAM enzyme